MSVIKDVQDVFSVKIYKNYTGIYINPTWPQFPDPTGSGFGSKTIF